jgi:hypothetical protein
MTSSEWRLNVLSGVVKVYRARVSVSLLLVRVFQLVTRPLIAFSSAAIGKKILKRKLYVESLGLRADNLIPELRRFKELSTLRQQEVRLARSQLLSDIEAVKVPVPPARLPTAIFSVLSPALHVLKTGFEKRKRRNEALSRIVDNFESATFYGDLLLWMILPDSFSEEALGDLHEEFEFRALTDKSAARAWYRSQVWSTLKSCLWKKVERLAAIGTIIDLIVRALRK